MTTLHNQENLYYKRQLEDVLMRYLDIFPVIGLTGPRQSGKSTMLLQLLKGRFTYVSFDDYKMTSLFQSDPERFMSLYNNRVIFDEVQKVPELFSHIKVAVDNDRNNYGKFILTGSSQFLLMKSITESLAGRIGLLSLLPLQHSEIPEELREEAIFRGGFPEIIKRGYEYFEEWYSAYIETYLEKDLRQLTNIGDLRDFRRFINLLAARTSQLLNLSGYARDIGLSVSTIKRWVSILETSYVIFLLPPFYENFGKRIVKSPKVYFYDTGMVSYLTGVKNRELFENGPMSGSIFENFVVSEIIKKERHRNSQADFYFLRTSHGDEIDLIVDRRDSKEFLEIKSGYTFRPQMTKTLENFREPRQKGILLYRGDTIPFSDNISVINYADFLKAG